MSNLVPAEDIEAIVGQKRHQVCHYGRAVSTEETLYILHSHMCKESGIDLRDCEYSIALDRGLNMDHWRGFEDEAVALYIEDGSLRALGKPRPPQRIQRKRTKGWKAPTGAVYVGRGSKWGNPFILNERSGLAREPAIHTPGKDWEYEGRISAAGSRHDFFHAGGEVTRVDVRYMTREEIVLCYRAYATGGHWPCDWRQNSQVEQIRSELAGKDLMCWCPLDLPCHADVLLELANQEETA